MIYVISRRIPDCISSTIALTLSEKFGNEKYISDILDRKCQSSKNESLFALSLLSDCMSYAGITPDNIKIKRLECGIPVFEPEIYKFSLSHKNLYAACAFSDSPDDVGVDIEEIPTEDKCQKYGNRFFTQAEAEKVKKEGSIAFTRIWTAKEAYAKFSRQPLDMIIQKENMLSDKHLCNIHSRIIDNYCLTVYSPDNEIRFLQ